MESATTNVQSVSRPRKKAKSRDSTNFNNVSHRKSKTLDLSLKNSRGELESLVRWIGGDSLQIKHRCSQTVEFGRPEPQWQCTCTVPLPFRKETHPMNPSDPITLKCIAKDSR